MNKRVMTVAEAIQYQKEVWGRVVFGRDALYAIARTKTVPVVRVGKGRMYFPRTSIEALLNGNQENE